MIKKFLTTNWQVKIICLIIALMYWTYVSAIGMRIDNIPGGILVETRNVTDGLIAITDIHKVQVNIISEKKLWSKITEQSLSAYIDCSNLQEGTFELPVIIESEIANIEISDYYPKKILVRIEKTISKEVEVKVKIEGEVAGGMVTSTTEVFPEKVILSGAKSIIGNVYEATAVVRMDGESESVKKNAKLKAFDAEGNQISNIVFDPEFVDIFVPIKQIDNIKNVGIKIITTGNISQEKWISSIYATPSEITISANTDMLNNINYISTRPINLNEISDSTTKEILLNIPDGVSIIDNIDKISVKITTEALDVNKEISANVFTKNIPTHLKLVAISPPIVNLLLSGNHQAIKDASSSNTKLHLDLGNFIKEGEYYIDLNRQMFEIPQSTNILNYLPSSIKVILQQK